MESGNAKSGRILPPNVRYLLTATVVLLGINFIFRLAFLLYNQAQFQALSWSEIGMGFAVGMRFDLATILIFNGLVFLYLALPIRFIVSRKSLRWCNILIILFNFPVIVLNGIDVVYFGYAEKRLTHELFTTKSDYGSFKPEMLMEWWWIFALAGLCMVAGYVILNRSSKRLLEDEESQSKVPLKVSWAFTVLFVVLAYFGVRGTKKEPLHTRRAFVTESTFLGNMGLNSALTVISSLDVGEDEMLDWVPVKEAVSTTQGMIQGQEDGDFSLDYPLWRRHQPAGSENHFNVVFLIIESLNASQVGCINGDLENSLTPNLDTLVKHGRMYTNFYANGVRSVEALPSIFNSMPEIFRRPTIGSHYAENDHYGLGHILGERNYFNAFFCGAHNGTMGFDEYAAKSGIPNYYGMTEYPYGERDFDGYWGCADGPFLQWMAEQQNQLQQPFFTTFFSISNHHPFNLPPQASSAIRDANLSAKEKTTRYSDQVLGEYFAKVSQYDWFERTVFVLTGDHCFHEESEPGRPIMANFHVPLFILGPCIEPGLDDKLGNHVSILPTLVDLMELDTWHSSAGTSLLDTLPTFAINNLLDIATLATDSLAFSTNFEEMQALQVRKDGNWVDVDHQLFREKSRTMEQQLRSIYQVLFNTRVKNRVVAD